MGGALSVFVCLSLGSVWLMETNKQMADGQANRADPLLHLLPGDMFVCLFVLALPHAKPHPPTTYIIYQI